MGKKEPCFKEPPIEARIEEHIEEHIEERIEVDDLKNKISMVNRVVYVMKDGRIEYGEKDEADNVYGVGTVLRDRPSQGGGHG